MSSLRAVRLYGKYLVPTGATAAVTHGQSYALSQAWGRALYEHRAAPDGILYHAQHDDEQMALALFDRARAKIMAGTQHDLSATDLRSLRLLDRYKIGLIS